MPLSQHFDTMFFNQNHPFTTIMRSNYPNPAHNDYPPELQKRLERLKITWGWSALLIGPLCIGVGIYCFVATWTGSFTVWWEENRVWQPSQCVILEHKLSFLDTPRGRASRPELLIEYEWDGTQYKLWTYRRDTLLGDAWIRPEPAGEDSPEITPADARARAQKVLDRYPVGSTQPCWVNPNDPSQAILRKWRYVAAVFTGFALAIFAFVLGIASMWHLFGKLLDRRRLLKQFEEHRENWNHGRIHPHRLEPDQESRGTHLAGVCGMTLWTTVTLLFAVVGWENNNFHFMVIPGLFSSIGLVWFVSAFWQLLFCRIGMTEVEMDLQPILPGQKGRVLVVQKMPLPAEQYQIAVRCRELTKFTQGSNTRTDSKEVRRQILHDEMISSFSGEPLQFELDFTMPDDIPVSFKSEHNEIRWEIVVEGRRRGKPTIERAFPFEVEPTTNNLPHPTAVTA